MKHLLFVPLWVALFAAPAIGQKAVEPPESPSTSPNSASRGSRRPGAPTAPPVGGYGAATSFFSTSKGDSIPPVMIRFSEAEAKSSAGLEEDLFVMARVISRTLERAEGDKVNYKLGVPMLLTGSGRSVRPMYIEGLGPLFMIKVSFPLLPPPKPEEKTARKRAADTEWVEAQRDVFATTEAWMEEPERSSDYSQERVELLQRELTGALKSAANMRGLKPEEFVNIAVFGHAPPVRIKSASYPASGELGIGLPATRVVYDKSGSANGARGSVLTLRARKSDIDDFASGKVDAEAFKGKVTTTTYSGSGIGITSINSWIQEGSSRFRGQ
jgi:hypothetical protein